MPPRSGARAEWEPQYAPTAEQAALDRLAAYEAGVPHGARRRPRSKVRVCWSAPACARGPAPPPEGQRSMQSRAAGSPDVSPVEKPSVRVQDIFT